MNHADYLKYQADVADFYRREGITHLTACAPPVCEACGGEWDRDVEFCMRCGESSESQRAPWFSKTCCDCCGTSIDGDREHAVGFDVKNPVSLIKMYTICSDCAYYTENGRLDDLTVQGVEVTL